MIFQLSKNILWPIRLYSIRCFISRWKIVIILVSDQKSSERVREVNLIDIFSAKEKPDFASVIGEEKEEKNEK